MIDPIYSIGLAEQADGINLGSVCFVQSDLNGSRPQKSLLWPLALKSENSENWLTITVVMICVELERSGVSSVTGPSIAVLRPYPSFQNPICNSI